MRKCLLFIYLFLFLTQISYAGESSHYKPVKFIKIIKNYNSFENYNTQVNNTFNNFTDENRFGAKLNAPNLVRLTENWYVGVEGGKDLYHTNLHDGWFAYGKLTYSGTLFDLRRK